jgi:hypothetical protein
MAVNSLELTIKFSNIGDNTYGQGLCSKLEEDINTAILAGQVECIKQYLYDGDDIIALNEVCVKSILDPTTGAIKTDIKNSMTNGNYHLYMTPLKRDTSLYGDLAYKMNVLFTKKNKLEFDTEFHKNFFHTNCVVPPKQTITAKNTDVNEVSIYNITGEVNGNNIYQRNTNVDDTIYTSVANAFIVRYNWVKGTNSNDQIPQPCSELFHSQPGLYNIVGTNQKLKIFNFHSKNINADTVAEKTKYLNEIARLFKEFSNFASTENPEYKIVVGDFNYKGDNDMLNRIYNEPEPGYDYIELPFTPVGKCPADQTFSKNTSIFFSNNITMTIEQANCPCPKTVKNVSNRFTPQHLVYQGKIKLKDITKSWWDWDGYGGFKTKYLKYKAKYLKLKKELGI